jgi:2-polyprenyl-3-methyl-5-hydroxy-6-metoxy-1,4-benzoquinol methylase
MHCPLCSHADTALYHEDVQRPYHQCSRCQLVFVPPSHRLSPADEKSQYDLHENDPDDPAYRRFLSRLFAPVCERIAPPARGLDFGCGPGPTLSLMFAEAGYEMAIYDPFYAPDSDALQGTYHFVTATEVAEHLHRPGEVFRQLLRLIRPGGWLGLMTKLVTDAESFADWHYKRDPTHVCFFSRATFDWWANQAGCEVDFIGRDVVLLRKPHYCVAAE